MYYSLLIICHCPFTYYMLHFLTTRIIYICNIATMALRAKLLRKHCWQFCLCISMCSKSVNSENVIISRHWAERRVDIWLFDIQMPFHIWIHLHILHLFTLSFSRTRARSLNFRIHIRRIYFSLRLKKFESLCIIYMPLSVILCEICVTYLS